MSLGSRFKVSMRRSEIAAGTALLLFACAILWGAFHMAGGSAGAPGPGYFPRALGLLLAAVSVGLIVRGLRLSRTSDESVALGHRDIGLTLVAIVGLGLLFEPLGYVASATLFMLSLLRAFSKLGWIGSLVAAIVIAVVTYYAFDRLLSVSLPAGPLRLP